ncbi:MAG TPA: hypothetical protein VGP56_05005 [Gaiellaceae bacterium]|nr:hypothetical protein [Gaiellaceae bacterium]
MVAQCLGNRPFRSDGLEVEVHARTRRSQKLEHLVQRGQPVRGNRWVVRDDECLAERVDVELD